MCANATHSTVRRFDGAVESLVEPHRLQQLLNALQHIALPLMRDGAPAEAQPVTEARTSNTTTRDRKRHAKSERNDKMQAKSKDLRLHVIPLLNMLLPALDPNDVTKASAAFGVRLFNVADLFHLVICAVFVRLLRSTAICRLLGSSAHARRYE